MSDGPQFRGFDVDVRGDCAAWAVFSKCEKYRYALARIWNTHAPVLVACLHNPSTATHEETDRTLSKVCYFARRDNFGGTIIVNPFAYRATDPKELKAAHDRGDDIVGPDNLAIMNCCMNLAVLAKAVAGWGRPRWKCLEAGIRSARASGTPRTWWCWGATKEGHPRHPLYLANATPLVELHEAEVYPPYGRKEAARA